jgi:hypothetical protein
LGHMLAHHIAPQEPISNRQGAASGHMIVHAMAGKLSEPIMM